MINKLHFKQHINTDLKTAWDFFSDPNNLPVITPSWLNFKIKSELPTKMYAGMIINYTVRPVLNIPVEWVTEITMVNEPNFFIDEQRFGPYKFWHHQHILRETSDGVFIEDIVHYILPFGFLGRLFGGSLTRNKIEEIFAFRKKVLEEKFGKILV